MILPHLLENLNKEAYLNLSGLLQQGIQRRSPLCLAQNSEPLFYSTQFILEVLIQSRSSHLLQCCLILIDISDPLLSNPVLGVIVHVALALRLLGLTIEVRRWADSTCR